jgi:hypothetical protein
MRLAVPGADRFGGVVLFAAVVLPGQLPVPEIRLQGVSHRGAGLPGRRGGRFAVERLPRLSFAPVGRRVSWHSHPGGAASFG